MTPYTHITVLLSAHTVCSLRSGKAKPSDNVHVFILVDIDKAALPQNGFVQSHKNNRLLHLYIFPVLVGSNEDFIIVLVCNSLIMR